MNGRKVLLVDADPVFLATVAARLVGESCQVCTAADAVEGLHGLRTHCPDLVLLNLDLPGGGGRRLCEHIQRAGDLSVPLICIAAPGDDPSTAESLEAAALLEQPVTVDEAVETVRRLLAAGGTARGGRTMSLPVLVVDCDEARRAAIDSGLRTAGREQVETTFAATIAEACELLRRIRYGCVLLADELPDGAGIDVLEEVEECLLTTPVIGMLSSDDPWRCIAYFRAGCVEVLVGDRVTTSQTLRREVAQALARFQRRAMATVIDRRQLGDAILESQEGLVSLARTDALMGICNRAVFEEYFEPYHDEIADRGGSYALCMIDVDRFKRYNDRYGHAAGDRALRRVADALASMLRGHDFIARYGGEEIVVLLDNMNDRDLPACVERLRCSVAECGVEHLDGDGDGVLTVSVGGASFDPSTSVSAMDVLVSADAALYRAKRAGRNRGETVVAAPAETLEDAGPVPGTPSPQLIAPRQDRRSA